MFKRNQRQGFTLIELAIVLAVAGLLFGGLFSLLSSSSDQIQDQGAARQHQQLIRAATNYVQGNYNAFALAAQDVPVAVPLADLIAGGFLQPSFVNRNTYGQTFNISVRPSRTAAATTSNDRMEIAVYTDGGDVISNQSGSRIAGLIGADGGFMYTPIAGTTDFGDGTEILGAFGGFNVPRANFGIAAGATSNGRIASVTFISGNTLRSTFLHRFQVPGADEFTTLRGQMWVTAGQLTVNSPPGGPLNGGILMQNSSPITLTQTSNLIVSGSSEIVLQDGTAVGYNTAAGAAMPGGGTFIRFASPGAIQMGSGRIQNAGDITTIDLSASGTIFANQFIYTSDRGMKNSIKALDKSLDKISQLRGVEFNWKENGKHDIGLVAQEVAAVYPELVSPMPGGNLGVKYGNLIGPMVEAIKELKAENAALKARLDAQERDLNQLKH